MSFPFTTNSFFGNPWAGSGLASFGLQQRKSTINFSVGTAAPSADSYVIRAKAGTMPTAVIENGYITFSVPQSHSYIGIGDKVVLDDGGGGITIYLNEKISTRKWKVKDNAGDSPANVSTALLVTTIDKTFNSVYDAINGDTSGVYTLLGGVATVHNLIAKKAMLQIVCYEMYDNLGSNTVTISGLWFVNEEYMVRIFVPSDIGRECNKRQMHIRGRSDLGGYRVSSSTYTFNMSGTHNIIDGLIIGDAGHTPGYAVMINSTNNHTQILNNVIFGAVKGIEVDTPEADEFIIANNVVRDCDHGIILNEAQSIGGACYNNTVINCQFNGIMFSDNHRHRIYNNIVQDGNLTSGKDINDYGAGYGDVHNCITKDTSCVLGINCHASTTLKFEDATNKDYRLHLSDTDAYMSGAGLDLSADSRYAFNIDINGGEIDNTWCVGAHHYVRETAYAVGPKSLDLNTASTYTITDSEMTFNADQTHEFLSAGCAVDNESSKYLLKRKLADDKWLVTDLDGTVAADVGLTGIASINFMADDLFEAIHDTGSVVETNLGSDDLPSIDMRAKVVCVTGSSGRRCLITYYTGDKNRNLVIFAPDRSDPDYIESNTNRRHNGKWNLLDYIPEVGYEYPINLPYTQFNDAGFALTIAGSAHYTVIDGLQITSSGQGVHADNVDYPQIANNIIKDCGAEGIYIGGSGNVNNSLITNNTIYRCAGSGIEIGFSLNYINVYSAKFGTDSVNDFYISHSPFANIGHIFGKYTVTVQAGTNKIEWLPGRVIITADTGESVQDVIDSGNITGTPWGTITPATSGAASVIPETRMEDGDTYTYSPSVNSSGYHYIYNNTIRDCQRGISIDSSPAEDQRTNVALLRNNLVLECEFENYYSSNKLPITVIAEYNWSDDQSINNFFGFGNFDTASVRFIEPSAEDYRLTLYDVERMDGLNLTSDEFFQVTHDNAHTDYESIPCWAVGANTWVFRNKEIHCSVGDEATDLSPAITSIVVASGIVEFDEAVSNSVGVGDRVEYDDGGATYCYLAERGTNKRWCAVNASGNQLSDMTSKSVTSINRVSNSLETALTTDITAEFPDISDKDIVTDLLNLFIWCYNDNDTVDTVTGAVVTGWVQLPYYRVHIQTPWDVMTQCVVSQRHSGVWGGYRISSSTGAGVTLLINSKYTIVRGLSAEQTDASGKAIAASALLGNVFIENNIVRDSDVGIEIIGTSEGKSRAIGNTVYDCVTGILVNYGYVHNNTVVGGTNGIVSTQVIDEIINNICQDQATTCFSGPVTPVACISSDASATGNGSLINASLVFVDKAGKDFHLHRNDWHAINRGVNLGVELFPMITGSETMTYPFYRDIDNEIIDSNKWSIGSDVIADIETIDLFYSYARGDVTNYRTGITPTVVIADGVVTFSEAQDNPGMGIGDKVDYDTDNKICYLYSKTSETEWVVRDQFGLAPSDIAIVDLNSITRAFSNALIELFDYTDAGSIQQFIGDSDNPFLHLRTGRYRINIAVFKDDSSDNPVVLRYFDSEVNEYIRFFVPTNELTECNVNQSHLGKRESFAQKPILVATAMDVILVYVPYSIIDGLVLIGDTVGNTSSLMLHNASNCKFVNNLLIAGYYGIGLADMGHDDFTGDDFTGGIRTDGYWHDEFDNGNWTTRPVTGIGRVAHSTWANAGVTNLLTDSGSPRSGDFDYEIGIVLGEGNGAGEDLHFALDDGAIKAEVIWKSAYETLKFNATSLNFPWKYNRQYRLRIVRGGDITSDGLYVTNGAKSDITTLYYLDDFNDGDGVGTNKWIEFPDTYTGWDATYHLEVTGPKWHGFSYISLWNEGDATPAKNIGRNANNVIANNVAYLTELDGIQTTGSDILYNNTVDESGAYCYNNELTDVMLNNIGQSGTPLDFKDGTTAEYCTASDSSLTVTDANKNGIGQSLTFVDKTSTSSNRDYHLIFDDYSAIWNAARLDRNIDYPFNFDGGRIPRLRKWDRGALEYQSNKLVFAVGYNSNNLHTKPIFGATTYIIELINDRSVLTFSIPQTNVGLGIGCKIIDNAFPFSHGCLLAEKITTSKWVVTDYAGNNIIAKQSGEVTQIKRVFVGLSEAFEEFAQAEYLGTTSLDTAGVRVVFALYDDEPGPRTAVFTAYLDNCTGDKHHNIKIMVPYDINTQCNVTQRHDSVYGDGFKLEPNSYTRDQKAAIYIFQHKYLEIEGLQISSPEQFSSGIHLYDCNNFYVGYNIIKGCGGHGICTEPAVNPIDDIINNLVYDCTWDGIAVLTQQSAFFSIETYITNNTIFNCRRGIFLDKQDYHFPAGLLVELKNNICVDSRYQDYVSAYENYFGRFTLDNCISSDGSAHMFPGLSNIRGKYVSFISRVNRNFNLSKFKDGFAVDSAVDFAADYRHPFFDDITNDPRDVGEYDRGAFEVIELIGSGDMEVGPVIIGGIGIESLIFQTTILYLREPGPGGETDTVNFLSHISPSVQFTTIEGSVPAYNLNAYVATMPQTDHLIIYMHGGKSFQGTFELQDRYPREVLIETYPPEASGGPASHIYLGPILNDVSDQGLLTYKNAKVYSNSSAAQAYLLDNTANTQALRFINSIVQVNKDSVIDNITDATVRVTNSILIYRNG